MTRGTRPPIREPANEAAYRIDLARPDLAAPDRPIQVLTDERNRRAAESAQAARLMASGSSAEAAADWSRTGLVLRDQYLTIARDAVRFPDDRLGTYLRAEMTGGAPGVVLILECDHRVAMVRHFRHATGRWHIEFPRGMGMPRRSSIDQAAIEAREEVGAAPTELRLLHSIYADSGLLGSPVDIVHGRISGVGVPAPDEVLDSPRLVGWDDLAALIASGEVDDGLTIAAFGIAVTRLSVSLRLPARAPQEPLS